MPPLNSGTKAPVLQKPEQFLAQELPRITRFGIGMIIDVLGGENLYLIQIDSAPMWAIDLSSESSFSRLAPTKLGLHAIGTQVFCTYSTELPQYAIILGSVPFFPDKRTALFQETTKPIDSTHRANNPIWHYLTQKNTVTNYNACRPLDTIPGSDLGFNNELGVGVGLSRLFAWIRASECAGMWCFQQDNLVRIHSHNLDHWHAGGERSVRDDEGEITDIDWINPYSWEAKGMANPKEDFTTENSDGGVYKPGQTKSRLEPKYATQQAPPRHIRFRGYLGDLDREMVVAPVKPSGSAAWGLRGLLDIQKHVNGLYTVRSAKGIIHEKYIFIPVPNREYLPEENADLGDSYKNYHAAGSLSLGTGDPHDKEDFKWSKSDETAINWGQKIYDYHAHIFMHYGIVPILKHKNDWSLPKSEDTNSTGDKIPGADGAIYNNFTKMKTTFEYKLPTYGTLNVDHRDKANGGTKYYCSRSIMAQLEDGSVLIEDGYGSSIHMTGGNLIISCPGDVWMRPGRNMNVWAPDDINLKAGTSIDITASNKDVRIKAEKNLHMLAGNGGESGGVLIESRSVDGSNAYSGPGEATTSYGITLLAKTSTISTYGLNSYISTIGAGGTLIFDAGGGTGTVTTIANNNICYTNQTLKQIFGYTPASKSGADQAVCNEFSKNSALIQNKGYFAVKVGSTILDSSLFVTGSAAAKQGYDITPQTKTASDISGFITTIIGQISANTALSGPQLRTEVYASSKMGDQQLIDTLAFSCRNEEQYGLAGEGVIIPESRWQFAYRQNGTADAWDEKAVSFHGDKTMPHPGYNNWTSKSLFSRIESTELFDWSTLQNDVAKSAASDGTAPATNSAVLQDSYIISNQN